MLKKRSYQIQHFFASSADVLNTTDILDLLKNLVIHPLFRSWSTAVLKLRVRWKWSSQI